MVFESFNGWFLTEFQKQPFVFPLPKRGIAIFYWQTNGNIHAIAKGKGDAVISFFRYEAFAPVIRMGLFEIIVAQERNKSTGAKLETRKNPKPLQGGVGWFSGKLVQQKIFSLYFSTSNNNKLNLN